MEKIVFTDGTRICLLDEDGKRTDRESGFIIKYKENARRIAANNAWKRGGINAQLRGDYEFEGEGDGADAPAYLNGVTFIGRENLAAYSFTVGQSSGVYYKDFSREKEDEMHLIHSNSQEFLSLSFSKKENSLLATVRKNGDVCYCVAQFTPDGDYNGLTDGDSRDENPSFSPVNGDILFDSAGAGRDERGHFVTYGDAALYALQPLTQEITPLKAEKGVSYVRPKQDAEGNLYAIRRPTKEKRRRNIFLEILLIPVRIVEAIIGFIQFFVVLFAGKTLVANGEGGNNPARGKKTEEREIFIEGNRIHVDQELKRNKRFKDKDYGFIPHSWQLVKLDKAGNETVLKSGVADYALGKEGAYCTDGKHVYLVRENGCKKLADTDFCLHIDVEKV